MVFTTEGLFEVAIESWPEWDLNPRPLNFAQTLTTNFVQLLQFHRLLTWRQTWQLTKAIVEMKSDTEQTMKLE